MSLYSRWVFDRVWMGMQLIGGYAMDETGTLV